MLMYVILDAVNGTLSGNSKPLCTTEAVQRLHSRSDEIFTWFNLSRPGDFMITETQIVIAVNPENQKAFYVDFRGKESQ